jgi:23S rRNA pseudouridine1911/1915/1917 synthase
LGWFAARCPAVLKAAGNREGGLLHRLDFQTEGLILFAKTREALVSLRAQQAAGAFVKEYCALSCPNSVGLPNRVGQSNKVGLPGFPAPPPPFTGEGSPLPQPPLVIESFFRPWGPGRRAVRPLTGPSVGPAALGKRARREIARDGGGRYRTELLAIDEPLCAGPGGILRHFTLRIERGFRHQIRCHLAWIGEPILNDALYGGKRCPRDCPAPQGSGVVEPDGEEGGPIALRARGFRFFDPSTGEQRSYRLPGFMDKMYFRISAAR